MGAAVQSSSDLPRAGRNLVAVIGIDAYEHWGGLHNAVSDARGVRDNFARLGFEVAGALFDGEATRHAISRLVDDLEEMVVPDDRLVVFFAGHGWSKARWVGNAEMHTGYLIPVDGSVQKHHAASWINVHELLRELSQLKALHVLVIIDACNAGRALASVFESARGSGPHLHEPFEVIHKKQSRMLIASALEDESARDGGIEPDHSLFTTFLLEGLQGGEPAIDLGDGRRVVHGSSLGQYVRHRVQCYDGDIGIRQNPGFGGFHLHKNGEMPIPLPRRIGDGTTKLLLPTYMLSSDPAFVSGGWADGELHDDELIAPPGQADASGDSERSSPRLRRPTEPAPPRPRQPTEPPPPRLRRPTEPSPPAVSGPMARPATQIGTLAAIASASVLLGLVGIGLLLVHRTDDAGSTSLADVIADAEQIVQDARMQVPAPVPPPALVPAPVPLSPTLVSSLSSAPPNSKDMKVPAPDERKPHPPTLTSTPSVCFVNIGVFPSGAEVVLDGRVIATPRKKDTPVSLPCKTPVTLTFRQDGWSTVTKTVVATEEGTHVGVGLKYLPRIP